MNNRTWLIIGIVAAVLLVACIACSAITGFSFLWFLNEADIDLGDIATAVSEGDQGPTNSEPTPVVEWNNDPVTEETLLVLENTVVPDNNPVELAERLAGIANIPDSVPFAGNFQVGDEQDFWVTDSDTNETSSHTATLEYAGDLVYFWVENGVTFDQGELNELATTFENEIIPTDRNFFGSEWTPGIDNDPHIYILYTSGLGFQVAGYFSSTDEIHPMATEYSNAHEMFLINADNSPLADEYTYGVLAHEFQHMIHWYRDRNETSWINEGMSELASLLNGYHYGGFVEQYTSQPDHQLNDWPNDENATTPYYGSGLYFVTYFLERFGNEATQALVADQANSLDSVDNVLEAEGATDGLTGRPISADDVVLDWVIANYLGDANVADGRYAYQNYPEVYSQTYATESISDCSGTNTRDVHQYGVDYIEFSCSGQQTLHFEGLTSTGLLPADANSGRYAFWSNKGDESDMTLTRSFDFSGLSEVTLDFSTWYDIETDWDYVYLLVSDDDGATWDFVTTPSGTDTDPTGNSYGWGYTGLSGGGDVSVWSTESVDLSAYAGKQVQVRFEYVTDAAVNGEGFMIDDVSIPELAYSEDFETGEGGWEAAGFARVENILPQNFRLALILNGNDTTVQIIEVPANNVVDIPVDFDNVDSATLVVMGATRFTRQTAAYRFSFGE